MASSVEFVIKPQSGWQPIHLREIWFYRDVLKVLVWRDIKIRYRQTFLGGLWAVLQPLMAMVIFTLLFNRMAHISSDGPPYPLFAFSGLIPWTFFAGSVSQSSSSLVANQQLVSKIYFPRIFIPIGAIGALVLDMLMGLALSFGLMLIYHWHLTKAVFTLPLFMAGSFAAAAGIGVLLAAANVRYRDVKYMVPFVLQMGMLVTPVIYPVTYVPARFRPFLALNPMTGMVLGMRHALLGTEVSWSLIAVSMTSALVLFASSLVIFRRMEIGFADVI